MLGLTTLTAMVSLHAQVLGLFVEQGLLPLGPRVARLHEALGDGAWTARPTLLFLTGADDGLAVRACRQLRQNVANVDHGLAAEREPVSQADGKVGPR